MNDFVSELGNRIAIALLTLIATAAVFALTFADLSNPEGVIRTMFDVLATTVSAQIAKMGSK